MIVRITVSSKLGPCVDPAMPGPCVSPGGVLVSPGTGGVSVIPVLGIIPARIVLESKHVSASAIANRFMDFSPLRVESYEDRIEHYHPRCLSKCLPKHFEVVI